MKDGTNRRLPFSPLSGRGSSFSTSDAELQEAIEKHYRYGTLFCLDARYEAEKARVKAEAEAPKVEKAEPKVRVVQVSDADAAKAYMAESYGVSRTKMKTIAQIKEAAAAHGVVFEGI